MTGVNRTRGQPSGGLRRAALSLFVEGRWGRLASTGIFDFLTNGLRAKNLPYSSNLAKPILNPHTHNLEKRQDRQRAAVGATVVVARQSRTAFAALDVDRDGRRRANGGGLDVGLKGVVAFCPLRLVRRRRHGGWLIFRPLLVPAAGGWHKRPSIARKIRNGN